MRCGCDALRNVLGTRFNFNHMRTKKVQHRINLALLACMVVSYVGMVGGFFYALVSFILYLAKDIDFPWWSVWVTILSFVAIVLLVFFGPFFRNKP